MAKIPVGNVASRAINFSTSNLGDLLRIGFFPILGSALFAVVGDPAINGLMAAEGSIAVGGGMILIFNILSALLWAVFAVAIHRLILFPDDDVPHTWMYLRVTGEELRYMIAPLILAFIAIFVFVGVITVTFGADILDVVNSSGIGGAGDSPTEMSALQAMGILLSFILMVFLYMRLVLVLPIIVAERHMGLRRAWNLSQGNVWRLIALHILVLIVFIILLMAVGFVGLVSFGFASGLGMLNSDAGVLSIIIAALGAILSFFFISFITTIMGIAILSYSYQELTAETSEEF